MKKTFCSLLLSSFCLSAAAQTDSVVAYARYSFQHVSDTTQPENPLKNNMMLYLGKTLSWYTYDRGTPGAVSSGTISGGTFRGTLSSGTVSSGNVVATNAPLNIDMDALAYNNSWVKDMSAGQLSYLTMPVFGAKLFVVQEDAPAINWNISTDTKTIMGMNCQKANGRFKGRDYEVWFSAEVPYSNGPWKLGGLPGLIIEAYDTRKEVVFTLTSFEPAAADKSFVISVPSSATKTNPKEYKQFKEAMEKDANATRGSTAGGIMVVTGVARSADGRPVKPRQMNNPLEKSAD